jgi:hypothetical protein
MILISFIVSLVITVGIKLIYDTIHKNMKNKKAVDRKIIDVVKRQKFFNDILEETCWDIVIKRPEYIDYYISDLSKKRMCALREKLNELDLS